MIITKQRNWYSWHTKRYVQALRNNIIEEDPLNVFSFFHDYAPRYRSKDARVICKKHWRALSANCMYVDSRNRSIGAFGAQNAVIENAGSICQWTYIFREDTRDLVWITRAERIYERTLRLQSPLFDSRIRAASLLHRRWSEQMARACMRWGIPSGKFRAKVHVNNVQNETRIPTRAFYPPVPFPNALFH